MTRPRQSDSLFTERQKAINSPARRTPAAPGSDLAFGVARAPRIAERHAHRDERDEEIRERLRALFGRRRDP